jgi:hypothetical protein
VWRNRLSFLEQIDIPLVDGRNTPMDVVKHAAVPALLPPRDVDKSALAAKYLWGKGSALHTGRLYALGRETLEVASEVGTDNNMLLTECLPET